MTTTTDDRPLFLSADEIAKHLTLHRSYVYRLMDGHLLPSIKIGRRRVVRWVDFERYLAAREQAEG